MEAKILAAVTAASKKSDGLYVHLLLKALAHKPAAAATSLRIARAAGEPFWLADLPTPVFLALVALTQAKRVSLATVSAQEAALAVEGAPQPHPLISLALAKKGDATFFLPMRLVLGAPPGSGGFSLVGSDSSRFDWHGAPPAKAAAKKPSKKPAAAKPAKKVAVKAKKAPSAAAKTAKPAAAAATGAAKKAAARK